MYCFRRRICSISRGPIRTGGGSSVGRMNVVGVVTVVVTSSGNEMPVAIRSLWCIIELHPVAGRNSFASRTGSVSLRSEVEPAAFPSCWARFVYRTAFRRSAPSKMHGSASSGIACSRGSPISLASWSAGTPSRSATGESRPPRNLSSSRAASIVACGMCITG